MILEKGTIGALKYAQDIEQKNYRIASKIDSAVVEIYSFTKFARGDDPFTDPDSPLNPNTESNQKRPINFNDLGLEGADTAAKWLAFKNSRKLFYNSKINEFTKLIQDINNPASREQAIKILNNSPKDFNYLRGNIRSTLLQIAKSKLPTEEFQSFVHDAAGAWEEAIHLGLSSPVNKFRKFYLMQQFVSIIM